MPSIGIADKTTLDTVKANTDSILGYFPIAGGIKSIQRGSLSMSGKTTASVTITSVDTTKSFLIFSNNAGTTDITHAFVRGNIASSTNLSFTRTSSDTNDTSVEWQVTEFN